MGSTPPTRWRVSAGIALPGVVGPERGGATLEWDGAPSAFYPYGAVYRGDATEWREYLS